MAKFEKGHKKIEGSGRQKGTPNKPTPLKAWIASLIDENRERFMADLEDLEPIQRVMVLEKLLNFVLPKMKSVELQGNEKADSMKVLIQNVSAFHRQQRIDKGENPDDE